MAAVLPIGNADREDLGRADLSPTSRGAVRREALRGAPDPRARVLPSSGAALSPLCVRKFTPPCRGGGADLDPGHGHDLTRHPVASCDRGSRSPAGTYETAWEKLASPRKTAASPLVRNLPAVSCAQAPEVLPLAKPTHPSRFVTASSPLGCPAWSRSPSRAFHGRSPTTAPRPRSWRSPRRCPAGWRRWPALVEP